MAKLLRKIQQYLNTFYTWFSAIYFFSLSLYLDSQIFQFIGLHGDEFTFFQRLLTQYTLIKRLILIGIVKLISFIEIML